MLKTLLFFFLSIFFLSTAAFADDDALDVPTQSVTGVIMDPVMRGESSPTPLTNAPVLPSTIYNSRELGDSDLKNLPADTERINKKRKAIRDAIIDEEISKSKVSMVPLPRPRPPKIENSGDENRPEKPRP